ncbi:MAG TPA: Nramp family divalent metal transporter, partial [Methylophilaceae bacterium]|nr:Nramp family divalent metal transporter [Methylophilaceae bacterium]
AFILAIVFSRVIYQLIENFMKIVALMSIIGLLWACASPEVLAALPSFAKGLLAPPAAMPRPWDPADATKLLTAITFAGLGGFWILFYSYWLRDKGSGMAGHMGRITGPLAKRPEVVSTEGLLPIDHRGNHQAWRTWKRFLKTDVLIGILGNLLTTMMMCLLAWALLFPQGLIPQDYEIAVVQSRFFEVSWGTFGRVLFLLVAAAFLADTWLATADAVSRTQADVVHILFPRARRWPMRKLYFYVLGLLTLITGFTMSLEAPGTLILISAVIGFVGTVIFPVALYRLNHHLLAPTLPHWARPSKFSAYLLGASFVAYAALALTYLWFSLHTS